MPTRFKTLDEIERQCKKQKIFYWRGMNVIQVGEAKRGHAIYDPFTGHFYGQTPSGAPFNSRTRVKGRIMVPLMKKLQAFFWEES